MNFCDRNNNIVIKKKRNVGLFRNYTTRDKWTKWDWPLVTCEMPRSICIPYQT